MEESGGEMGNKIGDKEKEEDENDEPLPLCRLCPSSFAATAVFNSGSREDLLTPTSAPPFTMISHSPVHHHQQLPSIAERRNIGTNITVSFRRDLDHIHVRYMYEIEFTCSRSQHRQPTSNFLCRYGGSRDGQWG
jgi:hypothetical protein